MIRCSACASTQWSISGAFGWMQTLSTSLLCGEIRKKATKASTKSSVSLAALEDPRENGRESINSRLYIRSGTNTGKDLDHQEEGEGRGAVAERE